MQQELQWYVKLEPWARDGQAMRLNRAANPHLGPLSQLWRVHALCHNRQARPFPYQELGLLVLWTSRPRKKWLGDHRGLVQGLPRGRKRVRLPAQFCSRRTE